MAKMQSLAKSQVLSAPLNRL